MKTRPNKPAVLRVFRYDMESGDEYSRETFHRTESAAHERLADILRRADDTYSRYEIKLLEPR